MNPPSNNVDKFGFPVPPKFEEPAQYVSRPSASRRKAGKWVLGVMLAAIVITLVVESGLGNNFRMGLVHFWVKRAEDKYLADDLLGALADIDHALEWLPDNPRDESAERLHGARGRWRRQAKDYEGSLEDFTRIISLSPKKTLGYQLRSQVWQQMGKHDKALDDMNAALRINPTDPGLYNSRAYTRAIAEIELKEALEDVERALKDIPDEPNYLDTRGYIHYLLGNYPQALTDLDRAIELTDQNKDRSLDNWAALRRISARQLAILTREWNEVLAVMHHHRGQIHEKLGHDGKAEADLKLGDKLGYNPEAGVY